MLPPAWLPAHSEALTGGNPGKATYPSFSPVRILWAPLHWSSSPIFRGRVRRQTQSMNLGVKPPAGRTDIQDFQAMVGFKEDRSADVLTRLPDKQRVGECVISLRYCQQVLTIPSCCCDNCLIRPIHHWALCE